MDIRPIETIYNGYKFRSRLEARWAVFFDALGVKYEYEPEGFLLPSGKRYLPDFRVKCWGTRGKIESEPFDLYIEVKGNMTESDYARIREFSGITDGKEYCYIENPVLIVGNIPEKGKSAYYTDNVYCNYNLIDGDWFGAYPAADRGKFFLWGDDGNYIWNVAEVERAYDKARQARFEHGEKG